MRGSIIILMLRRGWEGWEGHSRGYRRGRGSGKARGGEGAVQPARRRRHLPSRDARRLRTAPALGVPSPTGSKHRVW